MPKPRLFHKSPLGRAFDTRRQINMYLHKDQYEWLRKKAHDTGVSPSQVFRNLIELMRQGIIQTPLEKESTHVFNTRKYKAFQQDTVKSTPQKASEFVGNEALS